MRRRPISHPSRSRSPRPARLLESRALRQHPSGPPCMAETSGGGRRRRPAPPHAARGPRRLSRSRFCRGGIAPVLKPQLHTHPPTRARTQGIAPSRAAAPRDSRFGQNERLGDSAIRRFGARPGTAPEPRRTGDTGCTASSSQANMDRDSFNLDSTHQAGQVRDKERSTGEHREPTSCARRHRGLLPPFCRLGKRKPVSQKLKGLARCGSWSGCVRGRTSFARTSKLRNGLRENTHSMVGRGAGGR